MENIHELIDLLPVQITPASSQLRMSFGLEGLTFPRRLLKTFKHAGVTVRIKCKNLPCVAQEKLICPSGP